MIRKNPYESNRATVTLLGYDPRENTGRLNFDRVLFLDFDGVLHPDNLEPDRLFCYMPGFCEVIRKADPKGEMPIVISSMWRFNSTVDQMSAHFPSDIARQIIGVTPDLLDDDEGEPWGWEMNGRSSRQAGSREREILTWMSEYSPAGEWLAIDDRASYFRPNCPHLFFVPGIHDNEGCGLEDEVCKDLSVRLEEFFRPMDAENEPGERLQTY
jgi:HAD domain in Swiss Army Knife RNA repair proteins